MSHSRIPSNKRKLEKQQSNLKNSEELALNIVKAARDAAILGEVRIQGHFMIKAKDLPELPLVICCQPGGGYMCWFVDHNYPPSHRIYALVNENLKHIASFPLEEQQAFQDKLREIQAEMGETEED